MSKCCECERIRNKIGAVRQAIGILETTHPKSLNPWPYEILLVVLGFLSADLIQEVYYAALPPLFGTRASAWTYVIRIVVKSFVLVAIFCYGVLHMSSHLTTAVFRSGPSSIRACPPPATPQTKQSKLQQRQSTSPPGATSTPKTRGVEPPQMHASPASPLPQPVVSPTPSTRVSSPTAENNTVARIQQVLLKNDAARDVRASRVHQRRHEDNDSLSSEDPDSGDGTET